MGGGNRIDSLYSANITPDKETGIGNWSEEDFIKAVRFGQRPDGSPVRPPMKPFAQLSLSEAQALYAYMKTVPAIKNKVDRNAIHD